MKKLLISLMSAMFLHAGQAQDQINHQIEFGVDMTTPLIWAIGGESPYSELEFIYRESQIDRELRVKFGINNYNYLGKDVIIGKLVEDNKPEYLKYYQAKYMPTKSFLVNLGISKYFQNNRFLMYYGADVAVGIARGEIHTLTQTISVDDEQINYRSIVKNNVGIIGLTPIIGVKKHITDRILFGVEFGLNMHTTIGKMEYADEMGEPVVEKIDRFEIRLDKIINDIVFLVKI